MKSFFYGAAGTVMVIGVFVLGMVVGPVWEPPVEAPVTVQKRYEFTALSPSSDVFYLLRENTETGEFAFWKHDINIIRDRRRLRQFPVVLLPEGAATTTQTP